MTLDQLKNDMDKAYENFNMFSKEIIEKFKESKRKFANSYDKEQLNKIRKMKDDYLFKKDIYQKTRAKAFSVGLSILKDVLAKG